MIIYTKEFIQEKIQSDKHWLQRAVVAIAKRQDNDEFNQEVTKRTNHRGFTGADAKFLTSLAKWINSGKNLTEKQTFVARKRMTKYCGQLTLIANKKG